MTNRWFKVIGVVIATSLLAVSSRAAEEVAGYSAHPSAKTLIDKLVDEHHFERTYVQNILNQAEKKQSIIDAISRPAEKSKAWFEYREIFLDQNRIQQGVDFWNENSQVLEDASKQYGVEPEIIVAIIGVETRYGRNTGNYRVLDALSTLAFDYPPRSDFFAGQLEQFFILTREQKQDPLSLKGSYAGAMGYGQFIPSSYRNFATDNDGDGFADIWSNKSDAIGSVANYFKAHGWQTGQPVFAKAKVVKKVSDDIFDNRNRPDKTLKELAKIGVILNTKSGIRSDAVAVPLRYEQKVGYEYWLGFNNFYVITRYNRSHMYAKAVWDLSQAILSQRSAPSKLTKH